MSIESRIQELIKKKGPLLREDIFYHLKVNPDLRKEFRSILKAMVKEGTLYRDQNKRYHVIEESNFFLGTIQGTNKGYGFFIPDEEGMEDVFIHDSKLNTAMHGDKVLIQLQQSHGREEGVVVKIVERNTKTLVGTYDDVGKFGFVRPDETKINTDIYIPRKKRKNAKDGQKVLVEIEEYPTPKKKPEGRVLQVIGFPGDKGVDILSVAHEMGLPMEFPKEVLEEAAAIPDTVSHSQIKGRLDLRNLTTFTIDGADSKDFDDAISVEELHNGHYELGIHIADVAEYVRENSFLDREARKRGNSVYLIDKVIPMLPKELSNGICSLNEGVDRLTLSVLVEIDKNGKTYGHKIRESVIRSRRRLVYTHVSDFFEDNQNIHPSLEGLTEDLLLMEEVAKGLNRKRKVRGNIDFNFKEPYIQLDEEGHPTDITLQDHRFANKLIEEFMLLANETVAKVYFDKKMPFIYRIHEEPDSSKMESLNAILRPFGYHINLHEEIDPKEIQEITDKATGTDEEMLIHTMILRSMQKARYSPLRDIHFGLAAQYYSHFTSPIRRYADLSIHRVIKADLDRQLNARLTRHFQNTFPEIAKHVSQTERKAQEAERRVEDIKKAQYMEQFIGEEFPAKITGITSSGLFASLDNTVEGFISYVGMKDYFYFDEDNFKAVGEHSKREYHIGDAIDIIVLRSDPITGKIDFMLGGEEDGEKDEQKEDGDRRSRKKPKGHP